MMNTCHIGLHKYPIERPSEAQSNVNNWGGGDKIMARHQKRKAMGALPPNRVQGLRPGRGSGERSLPEVEAF